MAATCRNCGRPMPNDSGIDPQVREPCPICGSKGRNYSMSVKAGEYKLTVNDVTVRRDGFIGREKELRDLESFVSSGLLVAIIGETGSGKTSLLSRLIEKQNYAEWEWIRAGERGTMNQINTMVLRRPGLPKEDRPLVVIDDCEYLSNKELNSFLERLYSPRIVNTVILLSSKEIEISRRVFHYSLQPWYKALSSESKPTDVVFGISESESDIEIVRPHIILLGDRLIEKLKKYPNDVYKLPPRKFEELIADLLADQGCDVELTQQTRDGGKDIIATTVTPIGRVLTLVEAKRHRKDRLIDIALVRQLYGVLYDDHTATHAMFVTTSAYTQDARRFQKHHEYEMSLKEFSDVEQWIKNYKGQL